MKERMNEREKKRKKESTIINTAIIIILFSLNCLEHFSLLLTRQCMLYASGSYVFCMYIHVIFSMRLFAVY